MTKAILYVSAYLNTDYTSNILACTFVEVYVQESVTTLDLVQGASQT